MIEFEQARGMERMSQERWPALLQRIPTVFGRLVFLSQVQPVSAEDETVKGRRHHEIFSQWLALNLERQKLDYETFAESPGATGSAAKYRELIPAGAREVERQLYLTDLETVLALVRCERSGVCGRPAAWQPPSPALLRRFLPGTERPKAVVATQGAAGQ